MAGMIYDLEIRYEDRADVDEVRADQRDMAKFEQKHRMGSGRGIDEMTVQFLRYIGWAALRRLGRVETPFDDWEKNVTSVDEADEDEEGEEADPTNPAQ